MNTSLSSENCEKPAIAHERFRALLSYDEDSGSLRWLVSRGRVKRGDVAGRIGNKGYVIVQVDGRGYHAHRVVWMLKNGEFPTIHLDHIDGDRANNRIENLRKVTNAQNQQNLKKARSHSRSGILGVSAHREKWRAQIVVDGKAKHLGRFSTKEEAGAAYLKAKRALHPMCTI